MSRRFVITGIDTEVGKTVVGAALVRELTRRGRTVVAIKPFESDCDGKRREDGVRLAAASGQDEPRRALTRLVAPVAPPVAADAEGVQLDWIGTLDAIADLDTADVLVLEGAGGLLSPLTWKKSSLDLALELEAEVIVVAANRLGVQNHTLLTLRALEAAGVAVAAVALSTVSRASEASMETNLSALRRLLGPAASPIVPIPFAADERPAVTELADALALAP